MNEADTTGGYVQIHVQLSYFGLTCTAECVEKVADHFVSLPFSYLFVRFSIRFYVTRLCFCKSSMQRQEEPSFPRCLMPVDFQKEAGFHVCF